MLSILGAAPLRQNVNQCHAWRRCPLFGCRCPVVCLICGRAARENELSASRNALGLRSFALSLLRNALSLEQIALSLLRNALSLEQNAPSLLRNALSLEQNAPSSEQSDPGLFRREAV